MVTLDVWLDGGAMDVALDVTEKDPVPVPVDVPEFHLVPQ